MLNKIYSFMKILVIGHGRHGKDTFANMLVEKYNLKFISASKFACKHIIFPAMRANYDTVEECYNDKVNHREYWKRLISEYNKEDKLKLVKEVLKESDIYVGLRDMQEYEECKRLKLFDYVFTIYNPRIEKESSYNIPLSEGKLILNEKGLIDLKMIVDDLQLTNIKTGIL